MPVVEKLIRHVRPTVVRDFAPPPRKIDDGLWSLERRLRMPGGPILPTRTTVIDTGDGLLVVSPPAVEAGGLDALDAVGPVRHVVLPNAFHYLNAAAFLARYPKAQLWTAPGLRTRVASLPPGTEIGDRAPSEWNAVLETATLRASGEVSEVVFFHPATATLVLTDLAFHMVRFAGTIDRIAWRVSGVPDGFGPSRTARLLLLRDRERSRAFLRKVLDWPFRRIVVAHGDIVETHAQTQLRRAFAPWLD